MIELSDLLDSTHDKNVNKINLLLDVGQGRSQAIISYNQVLNYLEKAQQEDDPLYKFRAITNHHGPLKPNDPSYIGSLYNVMIEWETGEITEDRLNIIAQDDPVTCAEHAKQHNLLELPEWKKLKHIAKHQKTLIRAINQTKIRQVRRSTVYQFGFFIPRDYKHALELDKLNGTSRSYDVTKKELDQINDYKVFKDHGIAQYDPKSKRIINAPIGYQKIRVHLVFACKHDGHHKARLVAGGHLTPDPTHSIYSGVVSTRSLRLTIFLAKLNNMKVCAADIGNAYLEATSKEKLYIIAGPEFEELQGHILVIHKALYGLKRSGLRWSERIHDIMLELNFTPCKTDPCVWLRKMRDKYEYIAIYVDDLLVASQEPIAILHDL